MDNNLLGTSRVIEYIEAHLLEETLDLESVAKEIGYSKYHLHRMFSSVVGLTLHNYIKRRRMTECARMLLSTDLSIQEIALCAGYDAQRSFSRSFRAMYRCSPQYYRKHGDFLPLQLKYDITSRKKINGDKIREIKITELDALTLIGYSTSTGKGFKDIGKCWHRLHKNKSRIKNRVDFSFLIGVNDYAGFESGGENPVFRYIAGAQVSSTEYLPKGMEVFRLPSGRYAVFHWRGKNEDSLQPVAEYVYQEWFPHSTCRFSENNPYDFVLYGEEIGEHDENEIQYWVPIA
ncbi:AraC family transcriptional regulator [[Clostridium] symbiosum]|uniref:AraC family transcriptional regulator n=1 Tax=Clostridium symbiosum TaxID=1512 RepID=UPI001D075FA0|nr:AraC family transcriptional regulator [[Clostridium] symbiosum]MCB6608444.1 AraC family transcriptional regulator [[Clostridium] symbiosum]MCB6930658.1 AraC family transcriptional regulator [[Clostridium] symbiosum]